VGRGRRALRGAHRGRRARRARAGKHPTLLAEVERLVVERETANRALLTHYLAPRQFVIR